MKKGFTLIELLVVVSIISLLSSVVFSSIQEARSRASTAALQRFEQSIYRANALYLAGHWSLNESGPNFIDSANGNNGVGSGTYSSVPGIIGNAIDFIDGAITIPNNESLQITGDLSISMYIYPHRFNTRRNPINKAYGGEGTMTQENNGSINFYYGTAGGNSSPYSSIGTGAKALKLNEWNHILLIKDTAANTIAWWVNGKKVAQIALVYPQTTPSSSNWIIGDGYTTNYDGYIDEVKIYNSAVQLP